MKSSVFSILNGACFRHLVTEPEQYPVNATSTEAVRYEDVSSVKVHESISHIMVFDPDEIPPILQ